MANIVFAMTLFALVGSITPGPVNILAIRQGSSTKRNIALAYVLGASLSYTFVVWLMGVGGEQLLHHQLVIQMMKWTGALYLLYLAWRIATSTPTDIQTTSAPSKYTAMRALIDGGITQSFNPKAWMVALSGVGLFVLPQADVQAALWLFCGISLLACSMGVGIWALAGRLLAHWLAVPARQRLFNQVMGTVLALSVLYMLR